jgi:hypothetical protein
MNVCVKQEGVAEHNADDRNCVGDTQDCNYSGAITKPKESVQSDDQVTAVPAAHAERQGNQDTLNRTQAPAAGNELNSHPQR